MVERLRLIHPEAKALYMSGYMDNVILHHGILKQGLSFISEAIYIGDSCQEAEAVVG